MAFPLRYDGYSRVASLESLIFAGVRMTLAEMMNVLGPAIEEVRRDLGNSDQNRWLLDRCLSVLAFVDPPAEGIAKIREILSQSPFLLSARLQRLRRSLGRQPVCRRDGVASGTGEAGRKRGRSDR